MSKHYNHIYSYTVKLIYLLLTYFFVTFLLGTPTSSDTHYISQADLKHTEILLLQSLELYITMS